MRFVLGALSRARRLFTGWALPGWIPIVWWMLEKASTVDFLAEKWQALRPSTHSFVNGWGGIVLIVLGLVWLAVQLRDPGPILLPQVRNQHFRNETVRLDGREYINCVFTNCSFKFHGGRFRLTNCRTEGEHTILTKDDKVQRTILVAEALGLTKQAKFTIVDRPDED